MIKTDVLETRNKDFIPGTGMETKEYQITFVVAMNSQVCCAECR